MTKTEKIKQFRKAVQIILESLQFSEKDANDISSVYPEWHTETAYESGAYVNFNDVLYRCLLSHTSQDDWNPVDANTLWKKVELVEVEEDIISKWSQPLGSVDAYMAGDKVVHNNKTWISSIDNNVWEPGVYGWTEN